MALSVSFKGRKYELPVPENFNTLQDVAELLASELKIEPGLQKIVVKGRQLVPAVHPTQSAKEAGNTSCATFIASDPHNSSQC